MAGDEVRDMPMLGEVPASGLSILVDPPACTFDVVFVHGFTGHPYRTWKHKSAVFKSSEEPDDEGEELPRKFQTLLNPLKPRLSRTQSSNPVYWPRDLLPKTAPNARILTYGYDTNVRHRLDSPISQNTVYDTARDLMTSLEAARRSHPSRPLLFIAHSLGGIVVKEMLRQSWGHTCHQTHLQSISNSTAGAIFFGTPHGGADPGGLVRSIAESIARLLGWRVNEKVLDTLIPSSELLRQLRDEFGPIAHEKKWIIHCFQEEYPVKGLNGKVVEDSASCLNDATIETVQHIASNHMDMCRFSEFDDPEYRKVAAAVKRVLASASNRTFADNDITILDQQQRRKYMEYLKFDQIDARHATIKTAHAKTCKWLLTRPEYRDWLDPTKSIEHNGFLWIKGKPGTGKSTIMKYAFTQARKAMTDANHISFFFNARGEQLEKTTLGMYRSLLLQLLEAVPNLHIVLNKEFELKPDTVPEEILGNLEKVKTVFQAALRGLGDRKVVCYIDALDESDEDDVRDMISFFEQVCEKVVDSSNQFFVCFSSRHYPYIGIVKSIELVLEEQAGHQEDLAKYLDSELKIGSSRQSQDIKKEILERSSGIFLWVALVVKILIKEYDRGRVHALRKRLDELPNGLHELFSDILTRDGRNVDELVLCLQWILYAKRPLKREELYFAVLTGVDPRAVSGWDPDATTTADMERFILDCSKGLAELTKTKDQTVQFIHESVRDFLFQETHLANFTPASVMTGLRDAVRTTLEPSLRKAYLSNICLLLLRRNLIRCAGQYAACQHEVSQDLFFESLLIPAHPYWKTFNRCSWIYLNNILERHQIRRYTSVASFLYIFAEKNLPSLIRTVLNGTPDMDIAGERHRYPLNAAIAQDNEAAIREFLRPAVLPADRCPSFVQSSSTNGNQVDVAKFLLHNASDICSFKPGPVLAWAVAHAEQITIACLVATDKVDLNIYFKIPDWIPWYHVSLIVEAAQLVSLEIHTGGTTNLVPYHLLLRAFLRMPTGSGRLLQAYCLMQNVFNIRDEPLKVPLKVLFDEAGVMEFIIHDKGLDPNQCDAEGRTCLIYAAELGLKSNVKFLLKQNGLDVNAADSWNTTALHYAGKNRHGDIVGMLLGQPNLDINKRNTQGQTALHSAVAGHRSGVLEILLLGQDDVTTVCGPETSTERMEHAINNGDNGHLNQNINTNVMNSWPSLPASPGTDLARAENLAQMRTLNRRKIDVNATDNSGRTALHLAVQCYSRTMVLMLLRRPDINMDIVDKDGVTPMGAAIRLPPLMPQPVLHLRQVHPRYPPFRDPLLQ